MFLFAGDIAVGGDGRGLHLPLLRTFRIRAQHPDGAVDAVAVDAEIDRSAAAAPALLDQFESRYAGKLSTHKTPLLPSRSRP